MNKIKFCHNWNDKLNHHIFTTIRKYNQEKCGYYFSKLGEDFEILLNNKKIGEANLINMEEYLFKNIPQGLLHIDTGIVNNYEIDDLFKRFGIIKTDYVLILTFKRK